ncbi:thioredoxin-domain-containing protein [Coniophora puteana RWD-64-598 SS2]|uniref:Thioredoxin n=1 Tax=Coniophora puteana (strain RWD-64-598) TaxID=741705 RepID=A0A5M3N7D7_CONPW|nr:thioredoxin-domain-containing protein [Coniophora puteana RWD-64-598 SS2]EIW87004.1 thioredoxin-domain-containing protein [Coniophora puteana RWD-64-598 SS2]
MSVTHITSTSQLNGVLSQSSSKLTVIDFHASWCGPCHAIAPTYEQLAKQYTNVNFLKCDVDAAKDVAQSYQVTAMPTFVFLKGNSELERVRGANRAALESAVQRYSSGSSSTAAFVGKGQTLGSTSKPSTPSSSNAGDGIGAIWSNLSPQVKILVGLVAAYIFFGFM